MYVHTLVQFVEQNLDKVEPNGNTLFMINTTHWYSNQKIRRFKNTADLKWASYKTKNYVIIRLFILEINH